MEVSGNQGGSRETREEESRALEKVKPQRISPQVEAGKGRVTRGHKIPKVWRQGR